MAMFNKIVIIGVGLIGGSIGLAVKKQRLAKEVVGICRRPSSCRKALHKKACDIATMDYNEGLRNADFVIIATPVGKIIDIAKDVINNSAGDMILIDVGSTKEILVKEIEKITPKRIKFIGTHPMAGSEKSGVQVASAGLFRNSICIITKTKNSDNKAVSLVKKFWEKLGVRCLFLSPLKHDYYMSFASHLPHAVCMALAATVSPDIIKYTSTGFKDSTRIALSDPHLWKDIFMTNRIALLKAIRKYKHILGRFEKSIRMKDSKKLMSILERAKRTRDMVS